MKTQPQLSDAEWALLIELLQRERYELPAEIHHTRTSALRDELRERLATVGRLLTRLTRAEGGSQSANPVPSLPTFPEFRGT